MTIKSELVNPNENKINLRQYPYLAKSRMGSIVLFNGFNGTYGCGTIIISSSETPSPQWNVVGTYREDWLLDQFEPLLPHEVVSMRNT